MTINPIDIKKFRKESGMTLNTLADKLGVVHSTIINYEKGKPIPRQKAAILKKIIYQENCMIENSVCFEISPTLKVYLDQLKKNQSFNLWVENQKKNAVIDFMIHLRGDKQKK